MSLCLQFKEIFFILKITEKRKAFLDLLLDSADGADMTEKDILDQVDTFMFAVILFEYLCNKNVKLSSFIVLNSNQGHDTTSVALTWVLYCLATNPNEQVRQYKKYIFTNMNC